MKLYAPKYYKRFRCISDKCEHSCCVGWEIDIYKGSMEKYKKLKNSYGPVIMDSISVEGTPHFKLDSCDRCPHLDERGLCKIIIMLRCVAELEVWQPFHKPSVTPTNIPDRHSRKPPAKI